MNLISVGGASRSGSTLLAVLLGRLDGYFPVGELRYIWARGYLQNQLCGCGETFRDCSFWQAVLEEAYGSVEHVPIEEVNDLHLRVAQMKRLPELVAPIRARRFQESMDSYVFHLQRLCEAVLQVSGAKTLVDTSKQPAFCYLLTRIPSADVRLIHLVRDSRAVAFSYLRKKRKPDIHWQEAYMTRFSPPTTAFHWNSLNLAMELIRATGSRCQLLRYEDLVRAPVQELCRILPSVDAGEADRAYAGGVPIPTNHTVSGNPLRFARGSLQVTLDAEWETRMHRRERAVVTGLTWPLLRRYGYVGRSRRNAARPIPMQRFTLDGSEVRHEESSSSL